MTSIKRTFTLLGISKLHRVLLNKLFSYAITGRFFSVIKFFLTSFHKCMTVVDNGQSHMYKKRTFAYLSKVRRYSLTQCFLCYSRAHTIFGINFSQKFKNENGQLTEKTAVVNIVDLAGRFVTLNYSTAVEPSHNNHIS